MKYFAIRDQSGVVVSIVTTGLSASKIHTQDGNLIEEVDESFVVAIMESNKGKND